MTRCTRRRTMPEPDVVRNRALDRIGGALERQNKLPEPQNKEVHAIARNVIPVVDHPKQDFEGLDEINPADVDSHWDCTPTACKVAAKDLDFNPEDCPKYVKPPRMVMIPVSESSAQTLRECGYDP